jgi:glycosyltransferase involved in cell wall biosynthesis
VIRVGFVFAFEDQSWIGGLNYYRNLLEAVLGLPDRRIDPVVLTGHRVDPKLLAGFPAISRVGSRFLTRNHPLWFIRQLIKRITGHDRILENLCARNRIQVLSHSGFLRPSAPIKTMGWIFDFQHKHMPGWFDAKELAWRDRAFSGSARCCNRIILSSKAAQTDFASIYPEHAYKTRVLNFTTSLGEATSGPALESLRTKYSLPEKFFHLPNQFWIHKNHKVVIDALEILKARGEEIHVVCTGNTRDHRHPHHFNELISRAEDAGVKGMFHVLGIIPYTDMRGLMQGAAAVINPSLFEGWSSTVEEAKAMGKQALLSSIPVHLEQAPGRGQFFDPVDPSGLAKLMSAAWQTYDRAEDARAMAEASKSIPENMRTFGLKYQDLILELFSKAPA